MVTPQADRGSRPGVDPGRALTPAELKSRRTRNLAIGLLVGLLVMLVYIMTIAKLGPGVLNRPL